MQRRIELGNGPFNVLQRLVVAGGEQGTGLFEKSTGLLEPIVGGALWRLADAVAFELDAQRVPRLGSQVHGVCPVALVIMVGQRKRAVGLTKEIRLGLQIGVGCPRVNEDRRSSMNMDRHRPAGHGHFHGGLRSAATRE
jgi:hypothetical protein